MRMPPPPWQKNKTVDDGLCQLSSAQLRWWVCIVLHGSGIIKCLIGAHSHEANGDDTHLWLRLRFDLRVTVIQQLPPRFEVAHVLSLIAKGLHDGEDSLLQK